MKYAFITTNLAGGGAEKALLKLAAALRQRGHEVHLVLLEHLLAHALPADVAVHALTKPGRSLPKGVLGKLFAAWRLRRMMARLARPAPFDMVVSTLPFADETARRARLPRHWCRIANTLSAEIARLRARDPARARRRLRRYRRLYGPGRLIAVSRGVAADLRDVVGLAHALIECIYNPFDMVAIRTAATEPVANRPVAPYIIHVGRFNAQKRHDLLLDAYARLQVPHDLVLLTEPAAGLTEMIARRGLAHRVRVAGFQANPYPWIAGAALLVLCSDHEGLPNVIIEALILGVPVISTDCPSGPREILGRACPECLVPVNDAAALARAIERELAEGRSAPQVELSPYDVVHAVAAYERLAAQTQPVGAHGGPRAV